MRIDPTDPQAVRRVAVSAIVDPRSVRRELEQPGSVRGMAGHRIRRAIAEHSATPPEPSAPTETPHG